MDLLIKNGLSMDLASGVERHIALGITEGTISFICESDLLKEDEIRAEVSIDVQGAYIVPGWIDFHTHLFTKGSQFGVNGDLLLQSGATMAVDMGTAGCIGYEAFRQTDILPRTIKIKSFINLSPLGQPGAGISEPLSPALIREGEIEKLVEKYSGEILGLKVRLSKEIVGEQEIKPLEHALKLGERFELPVCVHTTNPPVPASEIAEQLRPGDIYSHMYHKKGMTILDESLRVQKAFHDARKRGVFLEVGNGRMNFNYEVAKAAFEEELYPDIISSDATAKTFINSPDMRDIAFVMSKFWNLGMPLYQIFASVTKNPARCLRLNEKKESLTIGAAADITIVKEVREERAFSDSDGNIWTGDKLLVPEMTVLDGKIVYLSGRLPMKKQRS